MYSEIVVVNSCQYRDTHDNLGRHNIRPCIILSDMNNIFSNSPYIIISLPFSFIYFFNFYLFSALKPSVSNLPFIDPIINSVQGKSIFDLI